MSGTRIAEVLALAVTALTPGCGPTAGVAPLRADSPPAPAAARVVTVKPERATVRRTTEQPGQVEPFETTPVHARLAGYVTRVAVNIGDRVTAGQVLAELSAPEVEAELLQKRALVEQARADRVLASASVEVAGAGVSTAEARLAEGKAVVRRAEADLARWQAESARTEQLARDAAVTGSLRDETRSKLDAAHAARDEARAQILTAEASVVEAKALRDKARANAASAAARVEVALADARRAEAMLGYATVRAPFDGVVTRRGVDTGHLTVPGGTAEPLFVVARTDKLTVAVDVPESVAPLVGPGDPARVRLQALGGKVVAGTVTRTSWALDAPTRTLRAEIDLPNPGAALRPGLYAYATIVAGEAADALTVPASAVARDGDKTFCVVVLDGRARRREVKLGLSDGTRVEALSGLNENDLIAADPSALSEGQPVQPLQPVKPPGAAPKP